MWKRTKGVMLRKTNKLDYTNIKAYQVISLLTCLEKVFKTVVAGMLAEWCQVKHILHSSKMGLRRQRSIIDIVAEVVSIIQEA